MNTSNYKEPSLSDITLEPPFTFHSPGVTRAFLLYVEIELYAPFKLGHDGGTEKHCIGIFTDVQSLDEFTGVVFGIPYSSLVEWHSYENASCYAYSVEILPLFSGPEHIQKYAAKMRDDILRLLPPTRRPEVRAEINRKIDEALSSK
jgi:hypothetical protein